MKNKRLEQIAKLVVDCEKRAESQEEYELLHGIYFDVQKHYKQKNGKYMRIREFVPENKLESDLTKESNNSECWGRN